MKGERWSSSVRRSLKALGNAGNSRVGRGRGGQILVGVLLIMVILSVLVPAMVLYVQNEAKWSLKQTRNMSAFQLAEGGVDRGYRKISESTTTWEAGQAGTFPADYRMDTPFTDSPGGCYAVSITSGPDEAQVTIIGVGIHSSGKEFRAIKAVYENAPMSDTAVHSRSGVTVGGAQTQVEWGAIVTPQSVTVNGRNQPQIWSSGDVDLDANGSAWPNCDQPNCVHWHSYENDIAEDPGLDPDWYYYAAIASGTYYATSQCWGKNSGNACGVACDLTCSNATNCHTDKTYYVNGDLCVEGTIHIKGALFVNGDLSLPNGNAGVGNYAVDLPREAWMQYGSAAGWAFYKGVNTKNNKTNCTGANVAMDPDAPATFPGLTSDYKSDASRYLCIDKIVVHGFTYVNGNVAQVGGAGSAAFIGAMYVTGTVTVTPNNFTIYYSKDAGQWLKTTSVHLTRVSWEDLPYRQWPTDTAGACAN